MYYTSCHFHFLNPAFEGFFRSINESIRKDIEKYRSYSAVKVDASFDEIYEASLNQNFIPIIDDRNVFIGLIKRKEVMMYIKKMVDNHI